ncbi:MAG: 5-bromo-4-chloroindolyl phosphate hydrolysis family protein [Clostridia bacterium]
MKKNYIYSAILGGAFFAVPYVALGIELLPSLAISAAAYGAGTLIFKDRNKLDLSLDKKNLYDILKEAKEETLQISNISKQIEDKEVVENIEQICDISNKIIDTLSKNPNKLGQARNFLNYYLPVTIKILTRYDEIENQRLNTTESKEFMESVKKMTEKIKNAFNEQLNNMYQTEMIDTDAEIKVFESMLKSDGFLNDININTKK